MDFQKINDSCFLLIADFILIVHLAFVGFVVLGLVVIWAGFFLKWEFVRNKIFRMLHLGSMAFVAGEAVLGLTCPLTDLENHFRSIGNERYSARTSLIQDIVHRILFYEFDQWVFTVVYLVFLIMILLTLWFVPLKK